MGSIISDESDSSDDKPGTSCQASQQNTSRGRRNLRRIKEVQELSVDSQIAFENEESKKERLRDRIELRSRILTDPNELVLEYNRYCLPKVKVHCDLVIKLKDHQKEGVKFMWDAVFESVDLTQRMLGTGCILAHCMGMGKKLQVIALIHTILTHPSLGIKRVLIFCPKSALLKWDLEFKKSITVNMPVVKVISPTQFIRKSCHLWAVQRWHSSGGVCLLSYDLFELYMTSKNLDAPSKTTIMSSFCDPGPELVIFDEGHFVKNEQMKLVKHLKPLKTKRRIILTGAPLQRNLMDYYSMVQFVRPYLLGTKNEFRNMFVNPITNGQQEDSSLEDIRLMKERINALKRTLSTCIQRYDMSTLETCLPGKFEIILTVKLSDEQLNMYRSYLNHIAATRSGPGDGKDIFADYKLLQTLWTHPYSLKLYANDCIAMQEKKGNKRGRGEEDVTIVDDEEFENILQIDDRRWVAHWWRQYDEDDYFNLVTSGTKLCVLLKIIELCGLREDKILVVTHSFYSLRMIEHFLTTCCSGNHYRVENSEFVDSTWILNKDYFLLTDKVGLVEQKKHMEMFNDTDNKRARLYLMLTKNACKGFSMSAANRMVIFDVSWDPSLDIQTISRIYCVGQEKRCFIYRLLSSGTMDEIIYERQVKRQSMSKIVIDEHQAARDYSREEVMDLYKLDMEKSYGLPEIPSEDILLKQLYDEKRDLILGCRQHDTLSPYYEWPEKKEGASLNTGSNNPNQASQANQAHCSRDLDSEEERLIMGFSPSMFNLEALMDAVKEKVA